MMNKGVRKLREAALYGDTETFELSQALVFVVLIPLMILKEFHIDSILLVIGSIAIGIASIIFILIHKNVRARGILARLRTLISILIAEYCFLNVGFGFITAFWIGFIICGLRSSIKLFIEYQRMK